MLQNALRLSRAATLEGVVGVRPVVGGCKFLIFLLDSGYRLMV